MDGITYRRLPLSQIQEPDDPARLSMDPETLGALADSIAAEGLHQPIGVRGPMENGRYELGFGHRRLCAHQLLQRVEIDCKVYPPTVDLALMRVTENGQREGLTPIEEAHECRKFVERVGSPAAVARLFRRSDYWVRARLALLELPDDLQAAVHRGELATNVATALARVDHADYRTSLIEEAGRSGASVNVVNVWVAHYEADKGRIIQNHLTVQEITERRQEYVVYFTCDGCSRQVPYTETRAMRFCAKCANEVWAAMHEPTSPEMPSIQR
jgi:ParB family transcriptional regulator, chromosome partitioning protein